MTLEPVGTLVARKQLSRRKLLDAARALFVERGYHDTRPQDIAREAGVGHGTFYLHFADKRECFLAFIDEAARELDEYTQASTQGAQTFADCIRGIIRGCIAYSDDHPGVINAALVDATVIGGDKDPSGASLTDRWAHDWTSRLSEMVETGHMAHDLDPGVIGHAIVGACHFAFSGGSRDGIDVEVIIDNAARFLARAIEPR